MIFLIFTIFAISSATTYLASAPTATRQASTLYAAYPCSWVGNYTIYPSLRLECVGIPSDRSASIYFTASGIGPYHWNTGSITPPDHMCIPGEDCEYIRQTYFPTNTSVAYAYFASWTYYMSVAIVFRIQANEYAVGTDIELAQSYPCVWGESLELFAHGYRLTCNNIPCNFSAKHPAYPNNVAFVIKGKYGTNDLFSVTLSKGIDFFISRYYCTPEEPCNSLAEANIISTIQEPSVYIDIRNEQYGHSSYPSVYFSIGDGAGSSKIGHPIIILGLSIVFLLFATIASATPF